MTTIREIAKFAKVSPATASKVINRQRDVSADAIARVSEAMAVLSYQPMRRGRPGGQKGHKKTNRIGLLTTNLNQSQINSPVYMDVLQGVEAEARKRGKGLLLYQNPPGEPIHAEAFLHKVDGILLLGVQENHRAISVLNELPCVKIMGTLDRHFPWDHVSYNNQQAGLLGAHYLLQRNYRRVATVSFSTISFFQERMEAFRAEVERNGGEVVSLVNEALLRISNAAQIVVPEEMHAVVEQLLGSAVRPEAVFLCADILTPAFYQEMYLRGLRPGRDMEVISCNNEELLLAHLLPRPATIDIHARDIGREAVTVLLERLARPTSPRVVISVEPCLVAGEECGRH